MTERSKLYIIDGSVLPEIFLKVCEAKQLVDTGKCKTIAEAVAKVGISRSAFYKYKDYIRPFRDMKKNKILTFNVLVNDEPGSLSAVLEVFAANRANIITINQSMPSNGIAIVTVSVSLENIPGTIDDLKYQVEELPQVIRVELLAG